MLNQLLSELGELNMHNPFALPVNPRLIVHFMASFNPLSIHPSFSSMHFKTLLLTSYGVLALINSAF